MSLMARKWTPIFFKLLRERNVVLERIFRPRLVEDIARVTNRSSQNRAGFQHGIERDPHVLNGIQRIKHAKNVHALCVGTRAQILELHCRDRTVTNRIGATKQHLKTNVRHALARARISARDLHGNRRRRVKSRAAPHLQTGRDWATAEKLAFAVANKSKCARGLPSKIGAHREAWCLYQQPLSFSAHACKFLALVSLTMPRTIWRINPGTDGKVAELQILGRFFPLYLRVAIQNPSQI